MSSEAFSGTVSQMRASPWLASEDLEGMGEVKATIEAVYKHTDVPMQDGRREKVLYSVKFAGKDKQMVLNATNRKALSHAYGARVSEWHGKTCTLFVQDGIRKPGGKSGETCKGLRIKVEQKGAGQ
jgi:hypothetical protein